MRHHKHLAGAMGSFAIIPVLDLKHGAVVHARAGDRANYRPIATPLAEGSAPGVVLAGLLRLAPFRTVYVADLDAIAGAGGHSAIVRDLAAAAPNLRIWLDGGFATAAAAAKAASGGVIPVLGSESLRDSGELAATLELLGPAGFVLSLDYRGGRFLGPAEAAERRDLWPEQVILMTLDRVGMDDGPDLVALEALVGAAKNRAIFAAGGVRDASDLLALRAIGVAGALVASALHDGRLSATTLAEFLG